MTPSLSNKKIRFSQKKMEGDPPFTPQIVISGWTAGGVRALWESEELLLANAIFSFMVEYKNNSLECGHQVLYPKIDDSQLNPSRSAD